MNRPPVVYWDTCVFLSWLGACKDRSSEEKTGLDQVVASIIDKKLNMITSVLTKAEILRSKLGASEVDYDDIIQRPNTTIISTDLPIWERAHDLRDCYRRQNTGEDLPTLTLADAVHLATAIIYNVAEFHTFDEKNRTIKEAKDINDYRQPTKRGLIPLSGSSNVNGLIVCKPSMEQLNFPFKDKDIDEDDE